MRRERRERELANRRPRIFEACEQRRAVAVTVAPELESVAGRLLADPITLDDGLCVQADVSAQEPLQTVGDLGALDAEALPAVWVPDSSLWTTRAGDAAHCRRRP